MRASVDQVVGATDRMLPGRAWRQAYLAAALVAFLAWGALLRTGAVSSWWVLAALAVVVALGLWARRGSAALAAGGAAGVAADTRARDSVMWEHIFRSVLDPIMAIDERGIVLAANPASERVFGWGAADLVGKNVSTIMGEPYRSEHDGYLEAYLRTGRARAIGRIRKVIGRRSDGSEFPCELSVSEVLSPEGRRFVGVVRDVSEREEFALRMASAERLAAVGELAAGIAHEVNNPVNTIINCAQMIKEGDDAPELCDHVIQEGMRIAGFVRELLNVASDRGEIDRQIDVHEPLQRALGLLAARMRQAGVEVHLQRGEEIPLVQARSHRLQQVFLNLLLNALDALRDHPRSDKRIDVRTKEELDAGKRFVTVSVRDNGPGVPVYAHERVFQPFFTTKKPEEGTGLGLAVSAAIVRDHQGRIALRSEVGAFAEFTVWLPAVAAVGPPASRS